MWGLVRGVGWGLGVLVGGCIFGRGYEKVHLCVCLDGTVSCGVVTSKPA